MSTYKKGEMSMNTEINKKFRKSTKRNITSMIMAVCLGLIVLVGVFFGNATGASAAPVDEDGNSSSTSVVSRRDVLNSPRSFVASSVREIYVSHSINTVNVFTHDSNDIRVVFAEPATGNFIRAAYEFNNGRLTIIDYWRDAAATRTRLRSGTLNIFMPRNANSTVNTFNINVAHGNIGITGQNNLIADRLILNVANGRIDLAGFRANRIIATTANGRVVAENITTTGDFNIQTANGNVDISDSTVSGRLTVRTGRGNITLTNVDTRNPSLLTFFGRIRIVG